MQELPEQGSKVLVLQGQEVRGQAIQQHLAEQRLEQALLQELPEQQENKG